MIYLQKCQHLGLPKKKRSSVNNFAFDDRPSARSLMETRNKRRPKNVLWWTPALTSLFKVTLCFLSFKKPDKMLSSLLDMEICLRSKLFTGSCYCDLTIKERKWVLLTKILSFYWFILLLYDYNGGRIGFPD